jgi:hypothetical protein
MKATLFTGAAAAALLLLAGCNETAEHGATAADATGDFTKAADALIAKVGQPGEKAEMPAANDPAVLVFNQQSEKALTALGTPAMPIDGFASFDAFCGKTASIVGAYTAVGTGGGTDAAAQQRMATNVEKHFEQLFVPLLFSAHCTAEHMPFLQKTVGSDVESKKDALQQVRQGAVGQVGGLLQMASAPDLDPARRRRIAELLSADAPKFAIVLGKAERAQMAQLADAAKPNLPEEARGQADKIRAAFEQTECGSLCAM